MDVMIELTRRCNLQCRHCLRGCAQNVDISDEIIEETMKKFSGQYISRLILTGGEPSLVPEKIMQVIKSATHNIVGIGAFYIATNGKDITSDFMRAVVELYLYCDDKNACDVSVSNDYYHDDSWHEGAAMLSAFKFFSKREETDGARYGTLVNDGMVGENGFSREKTREVSLNRFGVEKMSDENNIQEVSCYGEELIYINCKGNIVPACDLSYESQDLPLLIIANVMDDFTWYDVLDSYNQRLEESGCENVADAYDWEPARILQAA